MADDCRCQNCGNAGRFVVVVTHNRVNGQWCRNACSRNCADILARHGVQELMITTGYAGECNVDVRSQLTRGAA